MFLIKSAFVGKKSFVFIKMHGETTIESTWPYLFIFIFIYIWHHSTKNLTIPHTFSYILYIYIIQFYDEYYKGIRSQSYKYMKC